jgi:hypothetical protein
VPPPLSISTSDRAARRYLAILAAVVAALTTAAAVLVYVVDPFQVLRRSNGPVNFYAAGQYQIPGVARHYPYDAVVTGTSVSNNFRVGEIKSAFGWHAMNFSMGGATMREQRAVLETALATGKPRHVFWGIDAFAFTRDDGHRFPYYLYGNPGWRTAPYFVSLGAVTHAISTLTLPEAKRTSLTQWIDNNAWDWQYTYGRAEVLRAWRNHETLPAPVLPATPALADREVEVTVLSLIRAHPEVEFRIVLLPYSVLYTKLLLMERPVEFQAQCWVSGAVARGAARLPNARVHDFRDARDITHNLDEFKDLVHFSGAISRQIVREVAAGRHQETPEWSEAVCARLTADATAFPDPSVR